MCFLINFQLPCPGPWRRASIRPLMVFEDASRYRLPPALRRHSDIRASHNFDSFESVSPEKKLRMVKGKTNQKDFCGNVKNMNLS